MTSTAHLRWDALPPIVKVAATYEPETIGRWVKAYMDEIINKQELYRRTLDHLTKQLT